MAKIKKVTKAIEKYNLKLSEFERDVLASTLANAVVETIQFDFDDSLREDVRKTVNKLYDVLNS